MLRFLGLIALAAAAVYGILAFAQGDLAVRAPLINGLVSYTDVSGSEGIVGSMKSIGSGMFLNSP